MSKDEMTFELCSQLHNQYAEADNNKTTHIFSFISAMAIVFTAYGYAYEKLDSDIISFLSYLVLIVLAALSVIIINYGYSMRRDQFMIAEIRELCMDNIVLKSHLKTINSFDPRASNNEKYIYNFLPDYYNILFFFSLIVQLFFITFLLIQKDIQLTSLDSFFCAILFFVPTLFVCYYFILYYSKYKKRFNDSSKFKIWHKLSLSFLIWAILIILPIYFSSSYKTNKIIVIKELEIKVKNKSFKSHETKTNQIITACYCCALCGHSAAGADGEQQQRRRGQQGRPERCAQCLSPWRGHCEI